MLLGQWSAIDIRPGFTLTILSALQLKTQKLPPKGKLVALAVDEMSIKEGVAYDGATDTVEGFSGGCDVLANHAVAFVAKGITHRWKQPFGYFLSSGPLAGDKLQEYLFEGIKQLHAIGLILLIVITDQGSNNINLFITRLNVNVDRPYFMYGDGD